MRIILDAKHEKAKTNKIMDKQFQHLPTKELEKLLKLMHKFEHLFNGMLKNRSGRIEIKGQCRTNVLATLYSTEGTKNDVQKGIRKICEIGSD